jgi:hypothetical protein
MDTYFSDRYPSVLKTLKENNYSSIRVGVDNLSTESDLRDEILAWYDGYSWDMTTKVLNPISIVNFFDLHAFDTYWIYTYPSDPLLSNNFQNNSLESTFDLLNNISKQDIIQITPSRKELVTLMFQTGYLTVDKISKGTDQLEYYSLKVPNFEIEVSFYQGL